MRVGLNGRHLGPNKTGVGRYVLSLLQEWQRASRGHQFFVYTSTEKLEPEDRALFMPGSPMTNRKLPRPFGTSSYHLWYNFSLPRAVKRDRVDFFFSPDYFLPPFLGSIKRGLTIHDASYLAHPEWFPLAYRLYGRWYSKRPAATANLVLTVSEFSKRELQRLTAAPTERIVVTPEAADPRFGPSAERRDLSAFGLTGRYFLYVGKIFNRRHVAEMLQAFDHTLDRGHDRETQFAIRGQNETHPHIDIAGQVDRLNAKHGRPAAVLLPYVDDTLLPFLYRQAAGFFYLSTYEGFGLPVLEAMAGGTPTVTVRAGAIPEVAGDAAVYVNPTNIAELAEVMRRLLVERTWSNELRTRSIAQASTFSWAATASKTLDAITEAHAR